MMVNDSPLFRVARVIVGGALLVAGVLGLFHGVRDVILGIVGGVLLVTGLVGMPAIYALFGRSAASKGPKKP